MQQQTNKIMHNIILQVSLYDTDTKKTDSLFVRLTDQPDLSRIQRLLSKYYGDCRYCYALALHYEPYTLTSYLRFQNEVIGDFLDGQEVVVPDNYHIYTKGFPASDGLFADISYNQHYKPLKLESYED